MLTHVDAAVAYVSWDDQWVSYDTAETMATKMTYADENCLVSGQFSGLSQPEVTADKLVLGRVDGLGY